MITGQATPSGTPGEAVLDDLSAGKNVAASLPSFLLGLRCLCTGIRHPGRRTMCWRSQTARAPGWGKSWEPASTDCRDVTHQRILLTIARRVSTTVTASVRRTQGLPSLKKQYILSQKHLPGICRWDTCAPLLSRGMTSPAFRCTLAPGATTFGASIRLYQWYTFSQNNTGAW